MPGLRKRAACGGGWRQLLETRRAAVAEVSAGASHPSVGVEVLSGAWLAIIVFIK